MTEREIPSEIPRDELGLYWPSLGGRMAEILALQGRGPRYLIGAGKKAWYKREDVEAWLAEERERQTQQRAHAVKIPKAKPEQSVGRRPKTRTTKMDRYLAAQRAS